MGNNSSALTCTGNLQTCKNELASAISLKPQLVTCTSNFQTCQNDLVQAQANYQAMILENQRARAAEQAALDANEVAVAAEKVAVAEAQTAKNAELIAVQQTAECTTELVATQTDATTIIQDLTTARDDCVKTKSDLTTELGDAKTTIDNLSAEKSALTAQNSQLTLEKNNLQSALDLANANLQTATGQLNVAQAALSDLTTRYDACIQSGGNVAQACREELELVKFNASNLYFYPAVYAWDAAKTDREPAPTFPVGTFRNMEILPTPLPDPSTASFVVTPALPDGLSIDPVTGSIVGTPTTPSPVQLYTINLMLTDGSSTVPLATNYVRFGIDGTNSSCPNPCPPGSECVNATCVFELPPLNSTPWTSSNAAFPVMNNVLGTYDGTRDVTIAVTPNADGVTPVTVSADVVDFQTAIVSVMAYVDYSFSVELVGSPINLTVSATNTALTITQPKMADFVYSFVNQPSGALIPISLVWNLVINAGNIGYRLSVVVENDGNDGRYPNTMGTVMSGTMNLNDLNTYTLQTTGARSADMYALCNPRVLEPPPLFNKIIAPATYSVVDAQNFQLTPYGQQSTYLVTAGPGAFKVALQSPGFSVTAYVTTAGAFEMLIGNAENDLLNAFNVLVLPNKTNNTITVEFSKNGALLSSSDINFSSWDYMWTTVVAWTTNMNNDVMCIVTCGKRPSVSFEYNQQAVDVTVRMAALTLEFDGQVSLFNQNL